ncbi:MULTISPECIES: DUF6153 family protein [unclassified Agreia]|uniref:DUF6153 family protein n=1 Tax=unclassified Agreia TaxID=2641148 RepID=UPI000A721565|nr:MULTISPECIES: DUF6153 family protein [unclassified Agreia]
MSLMTLRATVLRPAAVQRTVLLLGVVVAIVAGLLAMHTIATSMTGHSDPATAAMAVTADPHATGTHSGLTENECAGDCAPSHDMTAMVCVLALLIGGALLLIGLLRGVQSHPHTMQLRPLFDAIRVLRSVTYRDPPDLLKLSISRT